MARRPPARDDDVRAAVDPVLGAADATVREWLGDPARDDDVRAAVDPVLGAADGNLGNVLWDGRVCRLVDFEDAGRSDRAFEVADLVEHVSSRLPRLLVPEHLFDALGLDTRQRDRVAALRPLYASFWLLMLLPGNPADRRNPPGSLADQARHVLRLLGQEVSPSPPSPARAGGRSRR